MGIKFSKMTNFITSPLFQHIRKYIQIDDSGKIFLYVPYIKTKVLEKWESSSKHDRGIIHVETIASNQDKVNVLSFRRKVLIKKTSI